VDITVDVMVTFIEDLIMVVGEDMVMVFLIGEDGVIALL
jgi:hypothetical protein